MDPTDLIFYEKDITLNKDQVKKCFTNLFPIDQPIDYADRAPYRSLFRNNLVSLFSELLSDLEYASLDDMFKNYSVLKDNLKIINLKFQADILTTRERHLLYRLNKYNSLYFERETDNRITLILTPMFIRSVLRIWKLRDFRKTVAVNKIKRKFKECVTNPNHPICKKRLLYEFFELTI